MTTRERILTIRLSEKVEKQPEYADRIGVVLTDRHPKKDRPELRCNVNKEMEKRAIVII